jgi:hypothetical protein
MVESLNKIPLNDYLTEGKHHPVFILKARPGFSPIDINLQFILREGWSQADRVRFHTDTKAIIPLEVNHPMASLLQNIKPHLLIRRYDKEQDSFLVANISLDGEIQLQSNDRAFVQKYIQGLFLEFPPSFHTKEEMGITEDWVNDPQIQAQFMGLLQGALGWDPSNQIPSGIQVSLEEAEKALSIANFRSCVVMCRRTIEALLRFAFPRLLGTQPLDDRGRVLSLDLMIKRFRDQRPPSIPVHLLHVLDSIRVVGNVPGAHAAEIEGYQFSVSDAEFVLASVHYFIQQYFMKIDAEVNQYYTLTIDLNEK